MLCRPCSSLLEGLLTEEGLRNFFKNNNNDQSGEEQSFRCENHINMETQLQPSRKNKTHDGLKEFNRIRFLVPKPPLLDLEALQQQKYSLAKALWTRNLRFDDNLVYSNLDCPQQFNDATLEPNLEVIHPLN